MKNVKCGFPALTCTKDLIVHILGHKVHFIKDKIPTIDEKQISDRGFSSSGFSIKRNEFLYSLFTNIGLTVQWDKGKYYFVHKIFYIYTVVKCIKSTKLLRVANYFEFCFYKYSLNIGS